MHLGHSPLCLHVIHLLCPLVVGDPLDQLRADAQAARFDALASSTQRNLTTQLKAFLLFVFYFGLERFPVSEDCLILYIQFLSRCFKSPASVKNYVIGLQTVSFLNNWNFPDLSLPHFRYQFKGISRQLAHTTSRATPLNPIILQAILNVLDPNDPFQASCWAVMLCGFLLFARIGNLLPKSMSFDPTKQLSRSDVFVAQDCVIFSLKYTKTIQNAERVLQVPLYIDASSPLCPKKALFNMIRLSPGIASDHLFSYRSSAGLSVITQYQFISFLKQKLSQCGYDSSHFSGHSLRRGGASWAFAKGVSSERIKKHGDWKSSAYLVYLDFSLSDMLQTTKTMLS